MLLNEKKKINESLKSISQSLVSPRSLARTHSMSVGSQLSTRIGVFADRKSFEVLCKNNNVYVSVCSMGFNFLNRRIK